MLTVSRIDELKSALRQRLLVIDGAMGTAIQARNLGPEDFGATRPSLDISGACSMSRTP